MSITTEEAKEEARSIQGAHNIKLNEALNIVARKHGFRVWGHMKTAISKNQAPETMESQIAKSVSEIMKNHVNNQQCENKTILPNLIDINIPSNKTIFPNLIDDIECRLQKLSLVDGGASLNFEIKTGIKDVPSFLMSINGSERMDVLASIADASVSIMRPLIGSGFNMAQDITDEETWHCNTRGTIVVEGADMEEITHNLKSRLSKFIKHFQQQMIAAHAGIAIEAENYVEDYA